MNIRCSIRDKNVSRVTASTSTWQAVPAEAKPTSAVYTLPGHFPSGVAEEDSTLTLKTQG